MRHDDRKRGTPPESARRTPTILGSLVRRDHPDDLVPILVLSSDEEFVNVAREIISKYRLEPRVLPLAGFGPKEVKRINNGALVDCRSYVGVSQKVVRNLRDIHPYLPILAVVRDDGGKSDVKDRFYGAGATICISEGGGREVLNEALHVLIRVNQMSQRVADLQETVRSRNFEIGSLRRQMDASQFQIAKRVQEQITVYRAARAMLSVFDFDDLANEIVRLATYELGAEVGSLMIIEGEDLVVRALQGYIPGEDPILGRRQKVGEGISGWVAREGKPLLIKDIEHSDEFRERGGVRYKTKSCVSCPMIARGRIRGVINITNKLDGSHFNEDDLRLLRTLAMTAAVALDNFELVEQIKRSETMSSIGELATRMAHEIRNPLHAIKMNIQILAKKFPMDDDDREYYDILLGEINRIEGLVKEVLMFAKDEKLNLVSCDINRVIERTMAVLKGLLDDRNIDVNLSLAEDLPFVHADEAKIEQALMNLVVNAVEAMPEGGSIYISSGILVPFIYPRSLYGEETTEVPRGHQEYVVVAIQDTGQGINSDNFEKILKPFFTTKTDGTGLGLSTTNKIIERHGGKLTFDSEPGVGTIFKIQLPAVEGDYPAVGNGVDQEEDGR